MKRIYRELAIAHTKQIMAKRKVRNVVDSQKAFIKQNYECP
jgi:hypothetical protein